MKNGGGRKGDVKVGYKNIIAVVDVISISIIYCYGCTVLL
jgi:hypothetical protein